MLMTELCLHYFNQHGVPVFAADSLFGVLGPYFLDGMVTDESYLQILQEYMWYIAYNYMPIT